ncbi:MAG: type II secretion system protein N [Candidatus Wallbacteria bacterium]|nr:type II secretion system protein N [Candidatus Wallbacteria bacterium]
MHNWLASIILLTILAVVVGMLAFLAVPDAEIPFIAEIPPAGNFHESPATDDSHPTWKKDIFKPFGFTTQPEPDFAQIAKKPVSDQKNEAEQPTNSHRAGKSQQETAVPVQITLTGILTGYNENLAIVNREIVHVGDYISGAEVVEIYNDRILLNQKGEILEITLAK